MFRSTTPKPRRKGTAIVELAVCLPVVFIMVLGSIEATSAIFLKQALVTSAYEGLREAARGGGTTASAMDRANAVLSARNIRNARIVFTPQNLDSLPRGEQIQVDITAPFGSNSPMFGRVIGNRNFSVRTIMIKE